MSPCKINVLMSIYTGIPCRLNVKSKVFEEIMLEFVADGIIQANPTSGGALYSTTALGNAWVVSMLGTPIPTTAFIDGNGEVIK
jgi:hypothetical protein